MSETSRKIEEPGIHFLDAKDYHADPCPSPSLSASIALPLLHRSPRHAWFGHPRLNLAGAGRSGRRDMDLGTAVHKLVLGRGPELYLIDADNYRSKAAQTERDKAYAAGHQPILTADLECAEAVATAARQYLDLELGCWREGEAEAMLAWQERDAWCRGMLDLLSTNRRTVLDLKTTNLSAEPSTACRTLFSMSYHFKAAFYERGLDVLDPENIGRRRFLFLFIEADAPYECALIEPDEAAMTIARKQVTAAIALWQRCMETGQWPGYPAGVHTASLPPWIEKQWLDRELTDPCLTGATSPDPARPTQAPAQPMEWTP
ncbi:MAG: PD-(D/E)XK nuclease-like domain-containing protein [Bradyrhizobium sp.]|uniref:PD-(D/E)XK nuclease-like domain-containing protein n=1 Tax=Bradyrhizobium sp. TaxID=376 RepID=UPI003D113219